MSDITILDQTRSASDIAHDTARFQKLGLKSETILKKLTAAASEVAGWGAGNEAATMRFASVEIVRLRAENERLRLAAARANEEICQALGLALGYPRFCDDQKNFPGTTEAHGVCVGDHVAETLATEAALKIGQLVEAKR